MRDSGADIVPPDVRWQGSPCDDESSALDHIKISKTLGEFRDEVKNALM
jgi:hypothetical protein